MTNSAKQVVCCVLVVIQILLLTSCSMAYQYESDEELGIGFGYSRTLGQCFVADIRHSKGDPTDITIPDEHNGAPVTVLGGYTGSGFPCPFRIVFDNDSFFSDDYNVYGLYDSDMKTHIHEKTQVEVENVLFKITLPSKLKSIENTDLNYVTYQEYSDGQDVRMKILRPVFYFDIAEDNRYFYTVDGKLYYRETDELFSYCIYDENNYDE